VRKRKILPIPGLELRLVGHPAHSQSLLGATCRLAHIIKHNMAKQEWKISRCETKTQSTRVVQKVLPHIFFSEYIYSKRLKFGNNINEYFFYTHCYST
jgi:hypothetical protein